MAKSRNQISNGDLESLAFDSRYPERAVRQRRPGNSLVTHVSVKDSDDYEIRYVRVGWSFKRLRFFNEALYKKRPYYYNRTRDTYYRVYKVTPRIGAPVYGWYRPVVKKRRVYKNTLWKRSKPFQRTIARTTSQLTFQQNADNGFKVREEDFQRFIVWFGPSEWLLDGETAIHDEFPEYWKLIDMFTELPSYDYISETAILTVDNVVAMIYDCCNILLENEDIARLHSTLRDYSTETSDAVSDVTVINHMPHHLFGVVNPLDKSLDYSWIRESVLPEQYVKGGPLAEQVFRLKQRALKNCFDRAPSLGEFVGELPETVTLLADTIRFCGKVGSLLRRKDISGLYDLFLASKYGNRLKGAIKGAATLDLIFKFGFMPLLEDLKKIADLSSSMEIDEFAKGYRRLRTRVKFPIPNANLIRDADVHIKTPAIDATTHLSFRCVPSVELQYSAVMEILDPLRYFIEAASLNSVLGTAWNLLPLSFVVDWFININDWIKSNSDVDMRSFRLHDEMVTITYTLNGYVICDSFTGTIMSDQLISTVPSSSRIEHSLLHIDRFYLHESDWWSKSDTDKWLLTSSSSFNLPKFITSLELLAQRLL